MVKLNKLADWNGFEGIRYAAKISELDQHDILTQFINDGANLPFGKMRCRNIFQCCNNIK